MTVTTNPSSTLKTLLVCSLTMLSMGMPQMASAADNRPHEHGKGELSIVVEDHDLVLEVRLPAADVVGFESSPSNDDQKQKVEQVLASFTAATGWFEPAKQAQCEVKGAQASLVGMSTDPDHHTNESAGKSSHESSHKHNHDHDHGNKHADASESEGVHSDFEGTMTFHCDSPAKLDAVAVLLFKSFPNVSELRVQMVTSTSQTSGRVSPGEAVLAITP